MKRLRIVVVCLAAALAFGLVPTASPAAAKGLVLRTPTQGVLTDSQHDVDDRKL